MKHSIREHIIDPVRGKIVKVSTINAELGSGIFDKSRSKKFHRLRRITGYLTSDVRSWNDAKQAEEHDRVKHEPKARAFYPRGENVQSGATHSFCDNETTRPRHARQSVKRYAELQGDLQKAG